MCHCCTRYTRPQEEGNVAWSLKTARLLQAFQALNELGHFAVGVFAPPLGLVVLAEPGRKVRRSGLLQHPGDEAVTNAFNKEMVDLLGNHVEQAGADHVGVGVE